MFYVYALVSFVTVKPTSDHDGPSELWPSVLNSVAVSRSDCDVNVRADSRIIVFTLYRKK